MNGVNKVFFPGEIFSVTLQSICQNKIYLKSKSSAYEYLMKNASTKLTNVIDIKN